MWWKSGQNSWKSAKSAEIWTKSVKIWANALKIRAKMASNVLCFFKNCPPNVCRITWNFFSFQKWSSWENIRTKMVQNFFGQVWGSRAKILRAPKHLFAPSPQTFVCSPLWQACPTFLVLWVTFIWEIFCGPQTFLWCNNELLWRNKCLDFDKVYAITRGDNESYSCTQ